MGEGVFAKLRIEQVTFGTKIEAKSVINNPLSVIKQYMKLDFRRVVFTDECRATLDGPDGFSRGWLHTATEIPRRIRRQQGGGGIMFWAGIMHIKVVGPFTVPEGVKTDSYSHQLFLQQNFESLYHGLPSNACQKFIVVSGEYWFFWVTINDLATSITGIESHWKHLGYHQKKCLCGKRAVSFKGPSVETYCQCC